MAACVIDDSESCCHDIQHYCDGVGAMLTMDTLTSVGCEYLRTLGNSDQCCPCSWPHRHSKHQNILEGTKIFYNKRPGEMFFFNTLFNKNKRSIWAANFLKVWVWLLIMFNERVTKCNCGYQIKYGWSEKPKQHHFVW